MPGARHDGKRRTPRPVTDAERAEMVRLFHLDYSHSEIARQVRRPVATVQEQLSKLGLRRRIIRQPIVRVERQRVELEDTRDLTGQLMGDPIPGRERLVNDVLD